MSGAVGWWERVTAPLRRADDGACHCESPLTDEQVGARGGRDDEWCWRCRRPIELDDEEAADA